MFSKKMNEDIINECVIYFKNRISYINCLLSEKLCQHNKNIRNGKGAISALEIKKNKKHIDACEFLILRFLSKSWPTRKNSVSSDGFPRFSYDIFPEL